MKFRQVTLPIFLTMSMLMVTGHASAFDLYTAPCNTKLTNCSELENKDIRCSAGTISITDYEKHNSKAKAGEEGYVLFLRSDKTPYGSICNRGHARSYESGSHSSKGETKYLGGQ